MAMPRAPAADEELIRGLAAVMDRDLRRQHVGLVMQRAGVSVPPAAGWLLLRLNEAPHAQLPALASVSPFHVSELEEAARELATRGLVVQEAAGGWELTPAGCETLGRIVNARQAHLEAIFAQWSPEQRSEMAQLLRKLSPQLVPPSRQVAA
jgi:hypothetical protein